MSTPHCFVICPVNIEGKPTDCVPLNPDYLKLENGAAITKDCWQDPIDVPNENAQIPVETVDANILLIGGEDDLNLDAKDMATRILNRLKKHGKEHLCQLVMYPGAGHLIEPPYMPLSWSAFHKAYGVNLCWGGECKPHHRAQVDAWKRATDFLNEQLQHLTKSKL